MFPRYETPTGQLVLVNQQQETVRVIESLTEDVRIINWSPDCRYLTGAVGEIRYLAYSRSFPYVQWGRKDIAIWDAVDGGRVQTIADNVGEFLSSSVQPAVIWHPASTHAVILGGCPRVHFTCEFERLRNDVIWNRGSNAYYPVGSPDEARRSWYGRENIASFNQVMWDSARNWLWSGGKGGVSVLEMDTGALVHYFPVRFADSNIVNSWRGYHIEGRFRLSPDGTRVIVYSYNHEYPDGAGSISVYTIDTSEAVVVNAEGYAAPIIAITDAHPVALSPDNRYLIAGYHAVRVWDLTTLPEAEIARLPIYRHGGPAALIRSLTFDTSDVIETISDDGIQHWNLHTGVFVAP